MPLRSCRFRRWAPAAVVIAALAPASVPAVEVEPGFTMRRVAPPPKDATRFISIQIERAPAPGSAAGTAPDDPLADIEPLEPLGPLLPPDAPASAGLDLFWERMQRAAGPDRLAAAAAVLERVRPAGATASRTGIRRLGQRYGAQIDRAVRGTRVSPALVLAVMAVESSGRADAVSHAGAAGLMQLMPATAARFNVTDRFDPVQSLRGGVAYLDWLLREFDGDAILALAGYNAGENAVKRHGGVPPYLETRAYIPKVVSAWRVAAELCAAGQRPASDRCAWERYAAVSP